MKRIDVCSGLRTLLWIVGVSIAIFAGDAHCDESTEAPTARFTKQAAEYEFKNRSTGTAFDMRRQPLLHWSNPARNGEDGAVFLWTDGDRPVVIGTCFTYRYRDNVNRKHSFHFLGEMPIEGSHRNRVIWAPPEDSLHFRTLVGAPAPAATPAARSAQLKLLARRFTVELTQKDGRLEQSRLVPQPLYRFDSENAGAIFSFAIGTDPEALLILEQRKNEAGKPVWHFAFARFTFYALEGFLKGESVWKMDVSESLSANILTRKDYQREPYITFRPDWLD